VPPAPATPGTGACGPWPGPAAARTPPYCSPPAAGRLCPRAPRLCTRAAAAGARAVKAAAA